MEVVVLDNASDDGSVEMIREEFPGVRLLAEQRRRGFGANYNRAVAGSSGELVFLLNPDAVVHDGTIDRLVEVLLTQPGVVAAGGPIAHADGTWRQDRPHEFPTPWTPLAKAVGIQRLRLARRYHGTTDGWPTGGAFLVSKHAFESVGGFDEDFFMYSEDTDFFARLIGSGGRLAWVPDAPVTHPFPEETPELSQRREAEIIKGELRYMRKHFGRIGAAVFRMGVVLDAALRVLVFSIPGLSRLALQHGLDAGYNRRSHYARLRAAIRPDRHAGLAELADEWNRRHAVASDGLAENDRIRDLVVFDSSTSWDDPWLASQHIATQLARRTPVLFVDLPESPVHTYRHRGQLLVRSRFEQLGPNLYRVTPAAPPGLTRPGIHRLTALMTKRTVRRSIRRMNADVHAVLARLSHVSLFDVGDPDVRVYYASDDFEAGAELLGRPATRLWQLEEELAAGADTIVAITPAIAERYRARGYDPVIIPNGVSTEAYSGVDEAPLPADVSLAAPVAGYIGQIGDRIDFDLLEAVADSDLSLLLVGPRQETITHDDRLRRLIERPDVQWVGSKSFADLPSYLRVIDVGLVPYSESRFNTASFPLKTLEYLAAGRPVVATPLPAVLWLDTDLITVERDPAEFAAAAAAAAVRPRTASDVRERREFAEGHSWKKRVDQLVEVLRLDQG